MIAKVGFVRKNHDPYIANFFNSYPLLLALRHYGLFACGIIKRKYLPKLKEQKLMKCRDYVWKQTDNGLKCLDGRMRNVSTSFLITMIQET